MGRRRPTYRNTIKIMKKKKYIIILTSIFSILLTVSILFNVKNILDNKKFLFDKKETCIKYKDEVLKKYPKSDIHNTDIVEIFYSPSENTCIGSSLQRNIVFSVVLNCFG